MISDSTLANYLSLVSDYGYWLILVASIFVGPLIAALAGYLVALRLMDGVLVFLVLFAADLIGDILFYVLGRWGGRAFVVRFGRYIGLSGERVARSEKYFLRHDWKILLFGKTQFTGLPTGIILLFSAGMFRMPFLKYLFYNVIVSVPKILVLELIGFHFGSAFGIVTERVFGYTTFVSLAIVALLIGGSWVFSRYLARKEKEWERDTGTPV